MAHPMIPHSRPTLDKADEDAVLRVLSSGLLSSGNKVAEFERAIASYLGVKGAVAVSSGTAALQILLIALKDGKRSRVVLPSYTCVTLLDSVYGAGLTPVIIDVDRGTRNISLRKAAEMIGSDTLAIVIPHTFGKPAELDDIDALRVRGVYVIEDCAQAIGATFRGRRVGSFGDAAVLSFYATKMITSGEGGMIVSNNQSLIRTIADLVHYRGVSSYKQRYPFQMSDIQAALGLSQLARIKHFIERRQSIARSYDTFFADGSYNVEIPTAQDWEEQVYYRYVFVSEIPADIVRAQMAGLGVKCGYGVSLPLHKAVGLSDNNFPETTRLINYGVSLPIYPSLSDEDVTRVLNALSVVFGRLGF